MLKMAVQQAKRVEVEVKVEVELSRLLPSQPWPKPQPFGKLADFFSSLLARIIHECRREAFEPEARRGFSQVRPT
jgi:hypothetical protein